MIILTYLLAGALAGYIAGLLGVGGGIIMVPVFILCFEAQGFDPLVLTHMAVATSLACIVFSSLSSARKHHALGAVDWSVFVKIAPGIGLGSVAGVLVAQQIDGAQLRILLGMFVVFVALKMQFGGARSAQFERLPKRLLVPAGVVIGSVSALFGIGGGTLSVPFFYRLGMPMGRVVGTAAACGFPIAIVAALTNGVLTVNEGYAPEFSWGYIYLPAVVVVSVCSIIFARFGALSAQRINADALKKIFSVCLFVIGIRFIFF